jgi:hypothetical protein
MSPLGRQVLRLGTVEDLCNETRRLPIHLRKRRAAHFRTPPIPDIALGRTLCEQLPDKDDSRRIAASIAKPPELLRNLILLPPARRGGSNAPQCSPTSRAQTADTSGRPRPRCRTSWSARGADTVH